MPSGLVWSVAWLEELRLTRALRTGGRFGVRRRPTIPGSVDDANQEGTAYTGSKIIQGQAACVRKAFRTYLKVVMLNGSTPASCSPMVMPAAMPHKHRR